MVGGARGQVGHHVQQLVVVVKEQDNVYATILSPQGVEVIVSVAAVINKLVTLQIVQVRPLKGLTKHKHAILILWSFFASFKCCSIAVNGRWGSWSSWSSCSATCGGGQRTRQRFCDSPAPSGGGSECSGRSSQQRTCNTADCPGETSQGFKTTTKHAKF